MTTNPEGAGEPDDALSLISAAAAAEKALVQDTLDDISGRAERWEDLLEATGSAMYEVDLGDVYVRGGANGQLQEFSLAPDVMSSYTYAELQDRINYAFAELRQLVIDDFNELYPNGGYVE